MFENGFFPLIHKPTRITKYTATCIDHIWTNSYGSMPKGGIILENISDHMITMQSSNIRMNSNGIAPKSIKIQKTDFSKYEHFLSECETSNILNKSDPDEAYKLLSQKLDIAFKNSTYEKKVKLDNKPWFDRELKRLRDKKELAYRNFRNERTSQMKKNQKVLRKSMLR